MAILTCDQLNPMGCGIPNCGHDHSILYLHAACHIKSGVEAAYVKATGTLKLSCAKCHRPVAELAIATAPAC